MSADNSGADRAVDVAIVGGGFGAISAALVLKKELLFVRVAALGPAPARRARLGFKSRLPG